MKRTKTTIMVALMTIMAVSCAKNDSDRKIYNKEVQIPQSSVTFKSEVMWNHLDERSIASTKWDVMDMLWSFCGNTVLLISEPGNPDIGIIRCDNPAARPLWAKFQQMVAGAKLRFSIITSDKNERDQWADNMENDGYHVVIWMDENGIYYGLVFDDDEWCKLTGLGC